MLTIFGGIGRLRVRTSFVSQLVRIDLLYSPLTLFRCECDFAQPSLYESIRNRTGSIIDFQGCIDAYLIVRSLRVLSC